MPVRDLHHDAVREALEKEGWTITHDPYTVTLGTAHFQTFHIDLAAERIIAAQRGRQRIAIEIKRFTQPFSVADVTRSLGQYILYRRAIRERDPERELYLAVTRAGYEFIFTRPIGVAAREEGGLKFLIFDPVRKEIARWIA